MSGNEGRRGVPLKKRTADDGIRPVTYGLRNHARAKAGITDWPENALRHSFASYQLAHFKNAPSTALELGHHDSRITFAHYRKLVKPKDAERYWNIRPATKANVVEFPARRKAVRK